MSRRRYSRLVLNRPWCAEARVCDDVLVDDLGAEQVGVLSRRPERAGQLLTLGLSSGQMLLSLSVVSSTPVLIGGELFHRICLRRLSDSPLPSNLADAGEPVESQ